MLGFMADPSEPATPVAGARERRRARARLDIARVALKLFQEHGYEATTVGDIAEAADYSVRSFYRFFTSKEDVAFLDIGFMLSDAAAAIASYDPARDPRPLWTVMREQIVASIDRFQEAGPEFAAAMLQTWMTDPALAGPFHRFCDRWHEVLAAGWSSVYGGADAEADLRAQQVAHYLVSTCQACFRVHVHTGRDLHGLLVEAYDRLEVGLPGFGPVDTRP
jgi:AcrR family transcriptional regulator